MTTSEFGEALIAAYEGNKANINNFMWKGPKEKDEFGEFKQEQIRLVDASEAQLQKFYNHCKTMLFNDDRRVPGRVNLLKEIGDQRDRCGVELFYREAEANKSTRFPIMDAIRTARNNAKKQYSQIEVDELTIGNLVKDIKPDFSNLKTDLIVEGGLDRLGSFDRSHITLTFILKQGIWFSKEEAVEFAVYFKAKFAKLYELNKEEFDKIGKTDLDKYEKLDVIKEKLGLPKDVKLYFNPLGLSYAQLKSILSLRTKKYSELNMEQLKTLRYKLLFALEDEVNIHIAQWNDRMGQIKTVADHKNYVLK